MYLKYTVRGFFGGPVVMTSGFQAGGAVWSLIGELRFYMAHGKVKKIFFNILEIYYQVILAVVVFKV